MEINNQICLQVSNKALNWSKMTLIIAALGLAQSCFEGSMYTFVFMWTPALKTAEEEAAEVAGTELPDTTSNHLGMIFAIFMVSVMVGSSIFKIATQNGFELYKIPLYIHGVAMFNFLMVSMFIEDNIVLMMFLCFEEVPWGYFTLPMGN